MVKIRVKDFSEEALIKLYCELGQCGKEYDEQCEDCEMPTMLHNGNETCTRMSEWELLEGWSLFKKKMRPIKTWYRDNKAKMQKNSNFPQELKEHVQKDHKWKCDLCEKQYTNREELKEHEYDYHEQKCDQC